MVKKQLIKSLIFSLSLFTTLNSYEIVIDESLSYKDRRYIDIILGKISDKDLKDIWTDKDTNLMWQVPIDKKEYEWSEAKRYCRDLNLGGYNDWKLPSRNELKTILTKDYFQNSKSYSKKTYIKKPLLKSMDMKYQFFWSATTNVDNTGYAWDVYFSNGNDGSNNKTDSDYVRCVRVG